MEQMKIELIYDLGCPNIPEAQKLLSEMLTSMNLPSAWQEWDRADAQAPDYVQGFGSPTILVDGKDVASEAGADASCCRIYRDKAGAIRGAPSAEQLRNALSHPKR